MSCNLPRSVVPTHYDLSLDISLNDFTFQGKEKIYLQIFKGTNKIILHSVDLKIINAKLNSEILKFDLKKENEIVEFALNKETEIDEDSVLEINFAGKILDNMKGLYKSKYMLNNVENFMVSTQFEPADARRAFPCFDEPAFKSTFSIDISTHKDFVVLSNMPEIKSEVSGELKRIFFDKTPKMSTYLVAYAVGYLDFVEKKSDCGNVLIRVYTIPGCSERGLFALDIACKTIPFYAEYFGCEYPLPKMDLLAVPDFSLGAMENWGLITYRETALLIDEKQSSSAARQRVALVVGHEIAHQWFGNLVTMEWWTDLWLNEGFATWIEYLCVDHCCPEFKIWNHFVAMDYSCALESDSMKTSHPIEVEVNSPEEIEEIFDDISYQKGASIIRMLDSFLGNETFKNGLKFYLKRHMYSNTKTEDLWNALRSATDNKIDVQAMMSTWTSKMGYPLVNVSIVDENSIKFSQKWFLSNGSTDEELIWKIPITICSANDPKGVPVFKFLLEDKEAIINLPANVSLKSNNVRINPFRFGFYRVNYTDKPLINNLTISLSSLHPTDRLGIINDTFALCVSGQKSFCDFLELVASAYSEEREYIVLIDIISNLSVIRIFTDHDGKETDAKIDAWLLKFFTPIYQYYGWNKLPTDSHDIILLRSRIISILGRVGHSAIIDKSRDLFNKHVLDPDCNLIESDYRGAIYSIVMRHGGKTEFDAILKLIEYSNLPEEKIRLLCALGSVDAKMIGDVFEVSLNSTLVRPQDIVYVIGSCCSTAEKRRLTWKFVKDNWETLKNVLTTSLLTSIMKYACENLCSKADLENFTNFISELSPNLDGFKRTIERIEENITLNINNYNREIVNIKKWLDLAQS